MFQSEMRFISCGGVIGDDGFYGVDDDFIGSITYSVDILIVSTIYNGLIGYSRLAIPDHQLTSSPDGQS